jgi:hypothetical protein
VRRIEVENDFDDEKKEDGFSLNLYTNKKGNKVFLSLKTNNKEVVKDISNMRNGDEIEFKLRGDYFILSLKVELLLSI